MKLLSVASALALSAFSLSGLAIAEVVVPKGLPQRVEIYPIPTLTLSDTQFLTGDTKAKAAEVTGELSLTPGTGRQPVVVLMHGSGGIGGNVQYWKNVLNTAGISTFVIDGVTGRGLKGVGDNQAALGRLNFILDIYRSLDILAKHPRIDPDRIVMMGFSRGGQAALYSSVDRFQKLWNKSGVNFNSYVVFYPDCGTTYRDDGKVSDRPIRIFQGTPDDYNPIASCQAYVERLKQAGADIQLKPYPNAQHGFDNPYGAYPPVPTKADQSVRNCKIREDEKSVLINDATKRQFTYKDECVSIGPTVGYDPEATQDATTAVTAFVQQMTTK
ncbi:dienelactone hydrolase family protein [Agrobacterium vaccinii]|uniref:dienelactone hydrolase family protein n=1 Tax=Agrobacterium vaccinii TaxID=2735528 RepID=UPI001E3D48CB|nr:dienelactone hydrolase family protein [Agrobacterium vaccinii]UHS59782.1 dienelactone hydrolase family protein [Agrobacterium vaccinii]